MQVEGRQEKKENISKEEGVIWRTQVQGHEKVCYLNWLSYATTTLTRLTPAIDSTLNCLLWTTNNGHFGPHNMSSYAAT